MEKLRKTCYVLFSVLAVIVALCTLSSVFRDTPNRFLKMMDFARIQFFLASLIVTPLFILLTRHWRWYNYALVGGLLGGAFINGWYLVNYTPLVEEEVITAQAAETMRENTISLLMANVKMKNRNARPLLRQINEKDPDLVLLMEVDGWWNEQLAPLRKKYPYRKEVINEVAYGMSLYAKTALDRVEVSYLTNDNVPSIGATITLANGRNFELYCVHPVPPTRYKKYPDNAGEPEMAMALVGQQVKQLGRPAVVAGDFNDVVWSYTDPLTLTEDLLHDVRVGRGFYNSFNAESWYMRWPLDHVLTTKEFRLKTLERLPSIDSDHFPMYVELVLP